MTVRVVTDSTADLPPALAQELGITVVPLNVHFGTEVYRDGLGHLTGPVLRHAGEQPQPSHDVAAVRGRLPGDLRVAPRGLRRYRLHSRVGQAQRHAELRRASEAAAAGQHPRGDGGLAPGLAWAGNGGHRGGAGRAVGRERGRRAARCAGGHSEGRLLRAAGHATLPGEGWANREGAGVRGLAAAGQARC